MTKKEALNELYHVRSALINTYVNMDKESLHAMTINQCIESLVKITKTLHD